MSNVPKADLVTVARGAALEMFDDELAKVAANIMDPNTPSSKKRRIALIFDFVPFPDRKGANLVVTCETKLSSHQGVNGTIFLQRRSGHIDAYSQDTSQLSLLEDLDEQEAPAAAQPAAARKPS